MNYDKLKKLTLDIISNKKYQWIATLTILFIILMMSSSIRLSNWDLLTDSTTGEKIPLALDPFYFLRIAETIVESDGVMPEFDEMRSPSTNVAWHSEILPKTIVGIYYITKAFGPNITLQGVGIASPVIFFVIGIILFFFLSYVLSKKKSVALGATALLAFAPSYLYRTMAGFSDHEAIGMIAIFSFFLVYALALKNFEKSWKHVWIYSILSGFMIAFVLATWGGAVTLVLTTMPFAFFMYWFFAKKDGIKAISFYGILLLSSILSPLVFGYLWNDMLNRFSGSYGLLVPFVFVFILIDFGFSRIKKIKMGNIKFEEYKTLYSLGATILFGLIGLKIIGKSIFGVFKEVWVKLINPFGNLGGGRLGATVAENAQPYLMDWVGQSGKFIFWLFILGAFIIGINFALNIRNRKYKLLFIFSWVIVVSGILFSRISSASLFNGTNFVSQSFYLLSIIFFGVVLLLTATKNKFKVDSSTILVLAILFFTLINGRSATRVFFLIAPFVAFSAAYFTGRIYDYARETNEEILRILFWGIFILAVIGSVYSVVGYYENVSGQAKYTGPSANPQWQQSMEWVRNNTNEGDIFVHWWDYGYWIQSLGKRPTVTDGGHSGGDQADHYIGRYILTTPNPESALSYMKTWNVSYLLIDQTDLGKYPAYSGIGGGEEDSQDRYSAIPVMLADDKQTRETANGTMIVFSGGSYLF
ncbi:MAG: STT3 domain-containing protein, partial [archaeon]